MKKTKNIIKYLKNRDLLHGITKQKELEKEFEKNKMHSIYCGFDTNDDSLHIGHLAILLILRKFQKEGHKPIVLLGNATAIIGDPSFRKIKRNLEKLQNIKEFTKKIKLQILRILNFKYGKNKAVIETNNSWFFSMKLIKFLKKVGNNFSIKNMIQKESIQNRLKQKKKSCSFSEFTYSLMQSYDYLHLYKKHNVILQIGGSDQWGNIVSGIYLIKKTLNKKVYGITVQLVTDKKEKKFGKTEKNTIWLDKKKTSPYQFYQFFINISDLKIKKFLRIFTSLSKKTIDLIMKNKKKAQKVLAEKITKKVHGSIGLSSAKKISKILFLKEISKLKEKDFSFLLNNGIPNLLIKNFFDLQSILVACKLSTSKRNSRELIRSNAIFINKKLNNKEDYIIDSKDFIYEKYILIRKGKKNYVLLFKKK
ncbi:tyrosine--tRNA ligase [bacterium endosymbiont of Pedicinus badii]|uniref:tyrosine--tRNA ligase n=1 Tax=bacterium endosymbiont of Pedicinus badii TaxID=1719126 RepID=UPI0009BB1E08|nr:tyrosine--tRNA ligase [bacterium endosymbiont of Pedicinus badii]OQM34401.1 hypothetical protein AOQ89_00735 [bacterium endosymbiont of Pedicinus badii]